MRVSSLFKISFFFYPLLYVKILYSLSLHFHFLNFVNGKNVRSKKFFLLLSLLDEQLTAWLTVNSRKTGNGSRKIHQNGQYIYSTHGLKDTFKGY